MRRTILAVHSDTHGGSKLGLMNPDTILYDEDETGQIKPYYPVPTATQEWLWGCYSSDIQSTLDLADGDDVLVLHNGDLTQGDKYPRSLVSTKAADQITIATNNLKPWLTYPNVKWIRIAGGTEAHNFKENTAETLVASMLQIEHKERDVRHLRHGLLEFNGYKVDYAHHGPHPGSRDWLRGNVALFYLRDLLYRIDKRKGIIPDLVLRSHYHHRVKVMLDWEGRTVTLMITPAYSGLDDHTMQAVRTPDSISCGMFAYEIVDGKLRDIHEFTHEENLITREVL